MGAWGVAILSDDIFNMLEGICRPYNVIKKDALPIGSASFTHVYIISYGLSNQMHLKLRLHLNP